jgi:hypothetical protein
METIGAPNAQLDPGEVEAWPIPNVLGVRHRLLGQLIRNPAPTPAGGDRTAQRPRQSR